MKRIKHFFAATAVTLGIMTCTAVNSLAATVDFPAELDTFEPYIAALLKFIEWLSQLVAFFS